jgi:hypothetical protein
MDDKPDYSEGKRLGTTFHRTFALNRPAVNQVLDVVYGSANRDKSEDLEQQVFRELTDLGTIYVEAMPRYCIGGGLLKWNYAPTIFGEYAYRHDPLLENVSTQWLMHYHLSAPQGPGPVFWHELVTTRFRSGDEFTVEDISTQIAEIFQRDTGNTLEKDSADRTRTAFLGTYTKSDGLSKLGLLEKIDKNRYRVRDDFEPPPTWAVAYAILDYWQSQFGGRTTINLESLTAGQSIASVMLIGAGRLGKTLHAMQSEGLVEVYRVAPPYQVVMMRPEPEVALQKIYAYREPE